MFVGGEKKKERGRRRTRRNDDSLLIKCHREDVRKFDVQGKEIHMSSFKYKDNFHIQCNYSPLFHSKLVYLDTFILHFCEELRLCGVIALHETVTAYTLLFKDII